MSEGMIHDESQWPLVILRFPSESVLDSDLEEFGARQRAMLDRGQPYVEIADASNARIFEPRQRRWMGEFMKATHSDATRLCKGLVVIIRSKIVQGGLTAVLWVIKPAYPMKIVASSDEAFGALAELAAKADLRLPIGAEDYLLGYQERSRAS